MMKKLIDEYKYIRPDAFMLDLVCKIQHQGSSSDEVRLSKFDADFIDKPEYAFCDGIAILPV